MKDKRIEAFWERLEQSLKVAGVNSLRDLCIRVGLPYQTLLNQRSQNRYPGIPVVLVLAHELKCSIDWLVFGDEVKQEDNDAYLKLIQKKEIIDRIVMSDSTDLLDYLENVLTAE